MTKNALITSNTIKRTSYAPIALRHGRMYHFVVNQVETGARVITIVIGGNEPTAVACRGNRSFRWSAISFSFHPDWDSLCCFTLVFLKQEFFFTRDARCVFQTAFFGRHSHKKRRNLPGSFRSSFVADYSSSIWSLPVD